jgi:hypothetical protein
MMTPQGLQIAFSKDPLAGLRVIANGIIKVDVVFGICIAGSRRLPMLIQSFAYLFLLHVHYLVG